MWHSCGMPEVCPRWWGDGRFLLLGNMGDVGGAGRMMGTPIHCRVLLNREGVGYGCDLRLTVASQAHDCATLHRHPSLGEQLLCHVMILFVVG